jgi:hypothetical protein
MAKAETTPIDPQTPPDATRQKLTAAGCPSHLATACPDEVVSALAGVNPETLRPLMARVNAFGAEGWELVRLTLRTVK